MKHQSLSLLIAALLAACGGGSGGGDTQTSLDPQVFVDVPATAAGSFKAGPAQAVDTDGDGIDDSQDPFPESAVQLAEAAIGFDVIEAAAVQGALRWPGILHGDLVLEFDVTGLDAVDAPYYGVLLGSEESAVVPLQRQGDSLRMSATTPGFDVTAAYVMNNRWRTAALRLRYLATGAPLFQLQSLAQQNQNVVAQGVNLQQVQWSLNGDALIPRNVQSGSATLTPGAAAQGGLLRAENAVDAYSRVVPVLRNVTVQRAADDYFQGEMLWASSTAQASWPAAASSVQILSPSNEPATQLFVHEERFGEVILRKAVIWPDELSKELNAEAILEALIFDNFASLYGVDLSDWQQKRSLINDLRLDPAADTARAELAQGMTQATEYDVGVVLQALRPVAQALAPATAKRKLSSKRFTTGGRNIYDVTVLAEVETTSGTEFYPQREFQNYSLDVVESATCSVGLDVIGRSSDLAPSELCLENDSKTFASASVFQSTRDLDSGDLSFKRVSNHIGDKGVLSGFDPNVVGGNFGGVLQLASLAYLSDNDGNALCAGQQCRVELLTGGFGVGVPQSLSATEKRIAEGLFIRTMVESILFPMAELITGGLFGLLDADCAAKQTADLIFGVAGNATGLGLTSADFINKLGGDTSTENIVAVLSDTYFKALTDALVDLASEDLFVECALNAGDVKKMQDKAARTADQVLGKAVFALQVVQTLVDQAEILFTPRKFTLEAIPLSQVKTVNPYIIDLTTPSTPDNLNALSITGEYIGAVAGSGDDFETYLPKVILEDAFGNRAFAEITSQNFSNPGNERDLFNRPKDGQIVVELNNQNFIGLIDLRPGKLTLSLEFSGYSEFIGDVLRIEAGELRLRTAPFLLGVAEGASFAGNQSDLIGYRIKDIVEALQVLDVPQQGSITLTNQEAGFNLIEEFSFDELQAYDPSDFTTEFNTLTFEIPETLPSGEYTVGLFADNGADIFYSVAAPTPLRVLADTAVTVNFADGGQDQDDRMVLELLSTAGQVLANFETGEALRLEIPNESEFADSLWYDPAQADVATIRIRCINGGLDGACTYALAAVPKNPSLAFLQNGKVPTGSEESLAAPQSTAP